MVRSEDGGVVSEERDEVVHRARGRGRRKEGEDEEGEEGEGSGGNARYFVVLPGFFR